MIEIYKLLTMIKERFQCFHVDISLCHAYEDENDVEGFEHFSIVIYTNISDNPVEIQLTTDEEALKDFDIEKCLAHLEFELQASNQYEFYENVSTMLH